MTGTAKDGIASIQAIGKAKIFIAFALLGINAFRVRPHGF
jgi:hypothetical protein